MSWTAVVPLKAGGDRKSRLAARLSAAERAALSDAMARHVLRVLQQVPKIDRIIILSETERLDLSGNWCPDAGLGLNAGLMALRQTEGPGKMLVVHGDLPLLAIADVAALIEASERAGVALAPDRHGSGTNALALADGRPFAFGFGEGSYARHQAEAQDAVSVIGRPGLAVDMDTPDDLDAATAMGWSITDLAIR